MEKTENSIGFKSVQDLLGMKFLIPHYQRGYRWSEQQVNDLLKDIKEFLDSPLADSEEKFYCLQPLVVKKRNENWEVIDGQQRLTTIFIILSYLKDKGHSAEHLYSLEYETRKGSADFLKNITASRENAENIDYYHMAKACKTIETFFREKDSAKPFADKLLPQVKFVWYEPDDPDPIEVFTRLNIGKIPLTNAELIKALFLNRSNFNAKDADTLQLRQREIAHEWDNIEYTLQNDEFWLFLHEEGYERPTRIDFIFDLICEQDKLKLELNENQLGTDTYKTFRYFYAYFKQEKSDVTKCWKEVKTYFQVFREWYDNLELYHYVGYLIACQKSEPAKLVKVWDKQQNKKISRLT